MGSGGVGWAWGATWITGLETKSGLVGPLVEGRYTGVSGEGEPRLCFTFSKKQPFPSHQHTKAKNGGT